jgi:capsular exopolysaccharide synthesis family protein
MIISKAEFADRTREAASGYVQIAARRKFLIGLPIAVCGAIAYLVASSLPPQYTAEAMLTLNTRSVEVIEIDSVVSRLPQENATLRTELDALSSRSMAARVARDLDLVHDANFLHELYAPRSAWQGLISELQDRLFRGSDVAQEPEASGAVSAPSSIRESPIGIPNGTSDQEAVSGGSPNPEPREAMASLEFAAINWLLNGLQVSNDGRSYTIRVGFTSHSPELSTKVANAFAEGYLADQIELKVKATREATTWLSRRLEELRHELEASEEAVQQFRGEADLLEIGGDTIAGQQLSQLNSQLIGARNKRLQLEARLQSVRQTAENDHDRGMVSDVLISPTVDALRMKLTQAIADAQLLQEDLGPRHPLRLSVEAQVAVLKQQLGAEIERARRSLENEVIAARNEEAQLEALLRADKGRYGEGGEAVVRLNQLQREAEANRTLYESLLNRYKQTVEQDTLATAEARLISEAVPPGSPAGPRKLPILLLGLIVGAGIGGSLATVLEWRDRSVRRIAEIEDMSGVPVFGVLPSVGRVGASPEELILDRPRAPFSEALRRTLVAFQLSHGAAGVKVIMVTSATAGESKTLFCVAAARALGTTGVRVLVIDADLRRPRVAAAFGGEGSVHIGDVIRGRVAFEEAVRKDPRSGAQFLAAVPERGDPQILLDSDGFATLLDRARERYDLVIIDTPPLLAATDAAVIGAGADVNLFLVRWGKTPRTVVFAALRFFSLCRITVDGIILTRVNSRRLAKYDDIPDTIPYRTASRRNRLTTASAERLSSWYTGQ